MPIATRNSTGCAKLPKIEPRQVRGRAATGARTRERATDQRCAGHVGRRGRPAPGRRRRGDAAERVIRRGSGPVSRRNTSSSELRRTSTSPGAGRARGPRDRGRLAVVGVDEHAVRQPLDAARRGRRAARQARSWTSDREPQLGDLAGGVLLDELARRPLGHDLRLVHDDEPVAQLLRLVHVVGRQDERHALLLEPVEALPEQVARLGVEAGRGLVEAAGSTAR